MIKRFRINKLFGFRNVNIPFYNNIKILIGENGLGKTTVLNSLYYVLTEKYNKLIQIEFERVELQFFDDSKIQFTKRELEIYIDYQRRNTRRHIPNKILETINLEELEHIIGDNELGNRETERIIAKYIASKRIPRWAPPNIMARELYILVKEPIVKKFLGFKDIIGKFSTTILYFPTYRRVEEDLKNLGRFRKRYIDPDFEQDLFEEIDEEIEISDDTLIHFGMEDVIQRIDNVKEQINKSTVEGFSKVTGEILSQLLKGFPELNDDEIEELDVQTAKIVLHRVGDNLSQNDRNSILELLDKPKDLVEKKELTYFLLNLIEIYNQHKHIDDSIKKFRDVCNEYLEDKEFRYNESNVDIDVYRNGTDEKVSLNKLSSGEKQIISLFSKIYLESSKNYIVLFDEPELSLSIEWQKLLLPHIVSSEKCKFLLSVTHSPFIFKNELVDYAVGMSAYIK
jgi:predicted ATP-binding protein involved in virulence